MQRLRRQAFPVLLCAIFSLCGTCVRAFAACDQVPAGETFQIRLLQPLSSYSAKRDMLVRGILLQSPRCDGLPLYARGTEIDGRIKAVHRVGLGFRHETAALTVEFQWIMPKDGHSTEIRAQVVDVHAARETVKKGVIQGIRGTDTPQNDVFFRLSHVAAWNPYYYLISPVTRSVFPIVPEPEIYFPPGTDLRVQLTRPLLVTGGPRLLPANREFDESSQQALDQLVPPLPQRSYNTKGKEADVVNLLFLGSEDQIDAAFKNAGWNISDPLNAHSILREFHAVFASSNYPRLPMAHHLLDGMPSDYSWEQSLDSYAKRDHLRIWNQRQEWNGQQVWLSAATAESGASWSFHTGKFVHHVEPDIDEERRKVVLDLSMAGCVAAVHNAPRATMPHSMLSTSETELRTDGDIAIVQLKDCQLPAGDDAAATAQGATRPHSRLARFVRTQVLSLRSFWRDNAVYDAVDLTRMGVRSIRNKHAQREAAAAAAAAAASATASASATAAAVTLPLSPTP